MVGFDDIALGSASWNLAAKTLSAFYPWAAGEGHLRANDDHARTEARGRLLPGRNTESRPEA